MTVSMNNSPTTSALSPYNSILRWITLIGWVLIVLAHLIIFLVDLVFDYSQMVTPCSGAACNFLALAAAEVAVLDAWGLTTQVYAAVMIAIPVIVLLVYWVLGGLILWQQGPSRLGLAVSLALIVFPIFTFAGDHDWSTSNPNVALLGAVVGILGTFISLVFLYLIPNGRFSPRWAYIPLLGTLLLLSMVTIATNSIISPPAQVESLVTISLLSLVLLGGGLQIYRYLRDSNSVERQQTKWILVGVLAYVLAIIVWVLIFGRAVDIPAGTPRLVANLVGWYSNLLTLLALPAAITIAILRYRLWDIDLLIRRTLIYSVLTATLAIFYFGAVIILQQLFRSLTGAGGELAIIISTLAIAALFNPLRHRVQDIIDQRFFRRKYDAQKILARFSATVRDEVELEKLTSELLRVVDETMQPTSVSLWLRKTDDRGRTSERAQ
jgi:hypothetical protein